ncbi:MAG: phosphoheptose isomerase [Dehalococcoidia bacterium]|nr:phosphoheptose isomerase [Dehalococcoidia bacterium]
MTAHQLWEDYRSQLCQALREIGGDGFTAVVDLLRAARQRGATIFLCGNGGSAATASHFASDLSKGANTPGHPPLRAISLTDNIPSLTAWANDTDYSKVFVEQLRTLSRPGDVLVAISGSGNSPNILAAARWARAHSLSVVGLLGNAQARLRPLTDLELVVPAPSIEQAEDARLVLEHAICTAIRALDRAEPALLSEEAAG